MKAILNQRWLMALCAVLALAAGNAWSKGGLVSLPQMFEDDSNDINNPWWPLTPGSRLIYIEEADDECIIGVLDIIPTVAQSRTSVNGVNVREVWDREFIDEDLDEDEETVCDGDLEDISDSLGSLTLLETTYDWYAQDKFENVWYFGEFTVAFDHPECDHTISAAEPPFFEDGCRDGSWEAGYDIWANDGAGEADEDILPGIIMLRNPMKGQFYFQEYWEDEATDMGKVLNFKTIDTFRFGEQSGCVVIKEWVPLDPGNVEHKYYCHGKGLLLVEGNAGGKTVFTDLVEVVDP